MGPFSRLCLIVSVVATPAMTTATVPMDYQDAMEICDGMDLRPVEGLWTYPEDDVTVLILRDSEKRGVYGITVVETADCSLSCGMRLGQLAESADPNKFTLSLYTTVRNGILSAPQEASATYSENQESLTVKKKSKINLRINPTRLLPSFWRIASLSLKSNESAPEGMIKIYPSYDGNGSTKRAPRYL